MVEGVSVCAGVNVEVITTMEEGSSEVQEGPQPVEEVIPSTEQPLVGELPGPGPSGPVGFSPDPSPEHVDEAVSALERIARHVSAEKSGTILLNVSIRHFRWDPLIARNLFGFHVYDFDDAGEWVDPFDAEAALAYGIAVNQSVEIQQEVVLVFLLQTAFRQQRQRKSREAGEGIERIDLQMMEEDLRAKREIGDRLRYGWKAAAETVRSRVLDAGFALRIRYEPDLIGDRQALVRRIPQFRRLYNEIPDVRNVIDKMVSMAGGDDPRLAAGGGSSEVRDWLQQQQRLWRLRNYQNQALRDAEVVGNGYLAFQLEEPAGPFNLRPEEVVASPEGDFSLTDGRTFARRDVIHIRGSRQLRSHYGVSILEPLLPCLRSLDIFGAARATAVTILESGRADSKAEGWARGTTALANRNEQDQHKRIRDVLWFPLNHLPDPVPNLYFKGHEEL